MANHFKYVCVVDFYLKQYITQIFFYCLVLKRFQRLQFQLSGHMLVVNIYQPGKY